MKMLQGLWMAAVLLGLVAGGCGSGQPAPADGGTGTAAQGGIEIRVANRSDRDFDQVVATFDPDRVEYGAVAKGATSEYRTVKQAYRYALVEVTAGGQTFRFHPIDYVGETPLEPGRYTYALNIEPSDNTVTIDLVED
ncbi:MAG TPA: hypothetical protein VJ885_02970 [Thermoanaerobaculia bacterium]|nr:hypothetical protein [Thermoanaerobaculia bacterium]